MSLISYNNWNISQPSEASNIWTGVWIFTSAVLVAFIAPMVAHESKISEFRQKWIDELRKDIADYAGSCRRWYKAQDSDKLTNEERYDKVAEIATEATTILWRIKMRINPHNNENFHQDERFLQTMDALLQRPPLGKIRQDTVNEAMEQSRLLLKREWEVTKGITPHWLRSIVSKVRRRYQILRA